MREWEVLGALRGVGGGEWVSRDEVWGFFWEGVEVKGGWIRAGKRGILDGGKGLLT